MKILPCIPNTSMIVKVKTYVRFISLFHKSYIDSQVHWLKQSNCICNVISYKSDCWQLRRDKNHLNDQVHISPIKPIYLIYKYIKPINYIYKDDTHSPSICILYHKYNISYRYNVSYIINHAPDVNESVSMDGMIWCTQVCFR